MAKLPKNLIKKHGISKKAWAIFRGLKKKSSVSTKKHRGLKYMAKRKHFGKKSTRFNFGGVLKILGGAAIAAAYEVFVSPMIPLSAQIKNIVELVLGLVLALAPGMPMIVRGAGAALAVVNAYAFVYPMIAGISPVGSSSSNVGNPGYL